MKGRTSKICCLVLLMLLSMNAWSQSPAIFNIKIALEQQVLALVRGYDANALVLVSLQVAESKDVALPSTLFTARTVELASTDGLPKISRIDVRIYTDVDIDQDVRKIISDSARHLTPNPNITILPALKGYKAPAVPTVDLTPKEDKEANKEPPRDPLETLENKVENLLSRASPTMQRVAWALAAATALLLLLLLFGLAGLFLQTRRHVKVLEESANRVAKAISEANTDAGGGSNTRVQENQASEALQSKSAAQSDGAEKQLEDSLRGLPDGSVLALLFDCYWAEADTYANFLWKRLPVARRMELLQKQALLGAYVTFIGSQGEKNLGFDADPYYLAPLPIDHLDNQALSDLVRAHPHLLQKLPVLRLDKLKLSASERLNLAKSEATAVQDLDFSSLARAQPRVLKKRLTIRVTSVQDENELMQKQDLDIDSKASVPSLVWALKLSEAAISEVLQGFSVTELSSAWIGPEPVLELFKKSLPERKLRMIEERLSRSAPSRDSGSFNALHTAIINRLRHQTQESNVGSNAAPADEVKDQGAPNQAA